MRRTTLLLLIVLEAAGLFIFENLHALFRELERNERRTIETDTERLCRLLVKAHGADTAAMGQAGPFTRVTLQPAAPPSRVTVHDDGRPSLLVTVPLPPGRSVRFRRELTSPSLRSMASARRIMTGVILTLAVLLLVSGWRLVSLLRRPRSDGPAEPLPPLQGYLAELRSSQHDLQEMFSEQARAAGRGEELNRTIIQNLHLAVMLLNPAGRLQTVNPAALAMFGRSYARIKNDVAASLLGDFPPLLEFVDRAAGRSSAEIDCGERIFFADVITLQDSGKLALIRDVSDEKKRERVQLVNANLIMLGEMAAALAHETRNSLGVVLGYAKGNRLDADRSQRIVREVQFLTDMMERFLQFSRPVRAGEKHPIDLAPLLGDLAAANDLALEIPDHPMRLTSDPALLNAIFSNLLRNAREAGARRVQVGFETVDAVAIEICDDGPGIPDPLRAKVWLPFFTTRDKGSGMGLPIVKKLVTALNGEIVLLPSDRGARLRIVFY